jgi:hypothetical protein
LWGPMVPMLCCLFFTTSRFTPGRAGDTVRSDFQSRRSLPSNNGGSRPCLGKTSHPRALIKSTEHGGEAGGQVVEQSRSSVRSCLVHISVLSHSVWATEKSLHGEVSQVSNITFFGQKPTTLINVQVQHYLESTYRVLKVQEIHTLDLLSS